jgi:hypothetical protein
VNMGSKREKTRLGNALLYPSLDFGPPPPPPSLRRTATGPAYTDTRRRFTKKGLSSVIVPCVSNGDVRRLQPALSAYSWPSPAILQHPPVWHHVGQPAKANHQPALSRGQWDPVSGLCGTNSTADSR